MRTNNGRVHVHIRCTLCKTKSNHFAHLEAFAAAAASTCFSAPFLIISIWVFLCDEKVSETIFLDREGLRDLLASAERGEVEFTPWSAYIIDRFLFDRWWDHVGDKEALRSLRDDMIHRVGSCMDSWRDEIVSLGIDVGSYLSLLEKGRELF